MVHTNFLLSVVIVTPPILCWPADVVKAIFMKKKKKSAFSKTQTVAQSRDAILSVAAAAVGDVERRVPGAPN